MAAAIAITPLRESSSQTKPIRRIFSSRSSLENPSPWQSNVLVISPSRTSTLAPPSRSRDATSCESVLLPLPESPVNHKVQPEFISRSSQNGATSSRRWNDLPLREYFGDFGHCFFRAAENGRIQINETRRIDASLCAIPLHLVEKVCRTNSEKAG